MDEYELFEKHIALKLHFKEGKYDYFLYHGKVKSASVASLNKRKDRYQYYKLSKKKKPLEFLIANMVVHGDVWIGSLVTDDKYDSTYQKWKGRQARLTYNFGEELDCFDGNFSGSINITNKKYSTCMRAILTKKFSYESAIILDGITNCFDYWDKHFSDDIIWKDISLKLRAYKPFVAYDIDKCKQKVLDKFT